MKTFPILKMTGTSPELRSLKTELKNEMDEFIEYSERAAKFMKEL